jgi:hypothetical protein
VTAARGIRVAAFLLCSITFARAEPWDDYRIVMWQDAAPPRAAALRALGVSGGKVLGIRTPFTQADVNTRVAPLVAGGLRWYVENIATDFYAPYHRWTPGHPHEVSYLFTEAQRRHRENPADIDAFIRNPSLSDPVWLARIRTRLADTVHAHARYRPLFYSLGDETGIADLAANWDFDFSPVALTAFRDWLRLRYGTLAALNRQWETGFSAWAEVRPFTTTEAMQRSGENFSPWADFKIFMDICFADAVRAGTDAVHAADPTALAGLEGMQVPGWGGYDYSRLAHAVDVMEINDSSNNVEIIRSLNPAAIVLATSAGADAAAQHAIWHSLLLGARGLILWDERGEVVAADGTIGARGRAYAPLFKELTGGLGAQLIASTPQADPVAILYSPASFRTRWMLDHRAEGDAWSQRTAEMENADNAVRIAMRRDAATLVSRGVQPRWLTPDDVATGALRRGTVNALFLPETIALSDAEATEISAFWNAGGLVITDGAAGLFDEHSRRRAAPALPPADSVPFSSMRWTSPSDIVFAVNRDDPEFTVTGPDGKLASGLDIRVFRNGDVLLIGLQQARADATDFPTVTVNLPAPAWVRDLRREAPAERQSRTAVALDTMAPTLLAISPDAPPLPRVETVQARAGQTATVEVGAGGNLAEAAPVLRVDVIDPTGHAVPDYSGNVLLRGRASASWSIPFAANAMPGEWTVRVRDVLGGGSATASLELSAP